MNFTTNTECEVEFTEEEQDILKKAAKVLCEKSGYIIGWEDCKEYVKSIITREIFASKGNLARQYGLQTVLEELD